MDDITPLNLEDSPKLFGLRLDQLVWVLISFVLSTQVYSFMNPVMINGQDLRLYLCLFILLIGPIYCLMTMHQTGNQWENLLNFYTGSTVLIPGPDPNPVRFLVDEKLPEFID